ncbi:Transcriptional regulator calC [Zalerion maritima]|uniref:Transcriptional regulator calC n=1 Tax=Zalerion maritima TaxID=339359 RepID=A0AAD5RU87_9PEZI|nr:Transcriptional regulator calC [Zalerion maritima]
MSSVGPNAQDRNMSEGGDVIIERLSIPSQPSHPDPGVLLSALHQNLARQLCLAKTIPWDASVLRTNISDMTNVSSSSKHAIQSQDDFNPLATILSTTTDLSETAQLFQSLEAPIDGNAPCQNETSASGDFDSNTEGPRVQQTSPPLTNNTYPSSASSQSSSFLCTPSMSLSSIESSLTPQRPSIAHLLTFLSCYLHTISIYDLIFSHLIIELSDMPESSIGEILPDIPRFCIAGYSVPLQGTLLLRVVVQVVENQFELVERVLGIPSRYAVSPERTNGSSMLEPGLLTGQQGQRLVQVAMEGGLSPVGGDDGDGPYRGGLVSVLSLKQNMKRVQEIM